MFLIIVDNDSIIYKTLDRNPYSYKGIRVSFKDKYYLEIDSSYCINDSKEKVINLERKHYELLMKDEFNPIHIYVYEDNKGIDEYKLYKNKNFLLSENQKAGIINKDKYLHNSYLVIKDRVIRSNSNCLFVNNIKVKEKELQEGDHIEYLGFSMYYYEQFFYINNFLIENRLEKKEVITKKYKYIKSDNCLNQHFPEPLVELEFEELKEVDLPKEKNKRSILLQIGPSITMSFAMLSIAIINVYNNRLNGGNNVSSLIFIMMPMTMLISGVIWPLINTRSEKKLFIDNYDVEKSNYLQYLKNYEERQLKSIKEYKSRLEEDILNLEDFKSRLFTYSHKNPALLKIFIGYYDINNNYIIKKSGDKDIDSKLENIERIINKVPNVPLFIDLNPIRNLTIITNNKYKDYYFNLFLLELSYKHHYDEVIIAIYKKEFNRSFNLPHMFVNNTRYSLNTERQLQDLNTIKTDKTVILFIYDKPSFVINNPLIKCIYVSNNENDMLFNSDTVIKYYSSYAYLINDKKIKFNYFIKDYDFNYYFSQIEKYQNVNLLSKTYTYKNRSSNYLIKQNYLNKQVSLKADFAYVGEELLSFDLHETKQGPHGLIGGTTGSGKSELIISFLLSLCMKYRPDYINIILIDYKGEGIKDSLSCKMGIIPHIVANISNLEEDAFERLIIKIRNECKQRQLLFNKLSSLTSLSIVNIDDYLENNNSRLRNIAHLIIVVDEFAELKKEYPELMKELVSLSRIGRSLGVHLILATQRPSGTIDDEIWSNSHFKIALKVNNEKDSQDLIKTKEAAYLNKAGEFYLQVDDSTIKAKSIYSKNDISGNERFEVAVLDNCLNIDKKITINNPKPIIESSYIVEIIIKICDELKIKRELLDFEKPKLKTRSELKSEYNVLTSELIIGEIDDYLNGKKEILKIDNSQNMLIYSNRSNEIEGLINSYIEVNRKMIIIGSKIYNNPLIIDGLLYENNEDIMFLFNKLIEYNQEKITLIIEDFSCFISYNDEYQELVYRLIQRAGVIKTNLIILSRKSTFNFKLLNAINNKYAINVFDNQDLLNLFCSQSRYRGKSFYQESELIPFVPIKIDSFVDTVKSKEQFIAKVPSQIAYEYKENKLLIGFSKKHRLKIHINDYEKLLITSLSKKTIDFFKDIYSQNQNVTVRIYDSKIKTSDFDYIIWLDGNRDKQTIFYDDTKMVIKENEGILIKDGTKEIIKVINYE